MDDIKRKGLEKACEKIRMVLAGRVAVCMVLMLDMSVEETADIRVRCPNWVRNRLRRYDEGGLEDRTQRDKDSRGIRRQVCSQAEKRGAEPVRTHAPTWEGPANNEYERMPLW